MKFVYLQKVSSKSMHICTCTVKAKCAYLSKASWYSKESFLKLGVMATILPCQCSYHDNRLKLYAYYVHYCNQGILTLEFPLLSLHCSSQIYICYDIHKRHYVQIVCVRSKMPPMCVLAYIIKFQSPVYECAYCTFVIFTCTLLVHHSNKSGGGR